MASTCPCIQAFLLVSAAFLLLLLLKITPAEATVYSTLSTRLGNETDRLSLLAFKSNIISDAQEVLSSWNDSLHLCKWRGVSCSPRHQRVTSLNLGSSGLKGSLSPFLGNLSFLNYMDLTNNTFSGRIPDELGRLSRLQSLYLGNNSFEGEIPANISHCSKLVYLHFGKNNLVGELPVEIFSLINLRRVSFSHNNITGSIPSVMGNLTSLEFLSLVYNDLGGTLPNSIGRLENLVDLGLAGNRFFGTIPVSFYNLSLVEIFSLSENQLHGILPPDFGLYFPNLQYIQLNDNNFTGNIPLSLSNCSELEYIELENNYFLGKVSVNFGGMKNLYQLSLFQNYLGSGDPDEMNFLSQLVNCSDLHVLTLSENRFKGVLPNSIANLSTQLNWITLGENQLFGTIPLGISSLIGLTTLGLEMNQLTGEVPTDIGKLQNLVLLALGSNQLSGKIPASIGNLTELNELDFSKNGFEGTIPSSIGNCKKLLGLSFQQNNLRGNLPKELFTISGLSVLLDLSKNQFSGNLPAEVGNLKNLVSLDLSENELYNEIPSALGSCTSLEYLYLQDNNFRGSIPSSFSSLRGIRKLDLSRNNLSGQIPKYLSSINFTYLNLSFNNFEGEVPTDGVFSNAAAFSLLGNDKLCGGLSTLHLPKCTSRNSQKSKMSHLVKILISVCVALFAITVVSFFLFYWIQKKRKVQTPEIVQKDTFLEVSYGDLLKATDGFSSENLIGVGYFGSVYKGHLVQLEGTVAIKVLNLQHRGAAKSFTAECEALRNIRHRNLVKIITSCSSIDFQGNDFKALVYEFMPKGSLDPWMHSKSPSGDSLDEPRHLNLIEIINVAIDVAYALEYLHHQCQSPIVHCDLKPGNILLDDDMIAHVGDFGLAKFLPEVSDFSESSSIAIRGTIGYAAPEYGQGSEVSINGDIYSYGILLLEMVTGKRPTDDEFVGGLNIHTFTKRALPDRVVDVVNPFLLSKTEAVAHTITNHSLVRCTNSDQIEICLGSLVKIGVACSVESPQDRMDIRDVISELQVARKNLLQSANTHIHNKEAHANQRNDWLD